MTARDILIYLSVKYEGDWAKMINAIKTKESIDDKEADKAIASIRSKTLTIMDADYPTSLKNCFKPPLCLFYYGNLDLIKDEKSCVSYVGDRDASAQGKAATVKLATALAKNKFTLVSGLARGIDSVAMETAAKAGGKVVGVLPCGIDICYPKSSASLCEKLKTDGLVISEYPARTAVRRENFPMRNRLIAALSRATIVGEAGPQSSALITVSYALETNKDIGCVPFPFGKGSSCNKLIREGAYLVDSEQDLLDLVSGGAYSTGKEDK